MHVDTDMETQVQELIHHSEAANAALMRGDVERWQALLPRTSDFTLMAPMGGAPTHEAQITQQTIDAMSRFFRNGTLTQEVVQTYATDDMVVLVTIERSHVEVGGLPAQDWALRATLVYRREENEWRLAHRPADPLVARISVEQSAMLARAQR
jgi:ketosteroid isomerase-like protein